MAKSDRTDEVDATIAGQELYTVIRKAIEDAMLHVLGTLVLVGIATILVLAGGYVFLAGTDPAGALGGIALILIGFYIGGVSLDVVPPVDDWV